MAAIAGYGGSVSLGAAVVAELDSWDLTVDTNMLKTTKFQDEWREQIAGTKQWNGKFSGRWDMSDTQGQLALQNAMLGGTTVSLSLKVDDTHSYSGTAFVKTLSPKASADGTVDMDFSFEGTAALTYA